MTTTQEYIESFSGESWEYFLLETKNVGSESAKVYLRYMVRYLQETDQTPEQFYQKILQVLENKDRRVIKKFKKEIQDYYHAKLEEGIKASTLNSWNNSFACFLKANELLDENLRNAFIPVINADTREKYPGAFESEQVDIAEVQHVRRMVIHAGNPRMVSQILTLRDTGLRVSDLVRIQIKHVQPILDDPGLDWHVFELAPRKNMGKRVVLTSYPCLGHEAVQALREWLYYLRDHYGVPLDNPEQHVYCMIQNKNGKRVGDRQDKGSVTRQIRYCRNKAGITKQITPHSFRAMNSTFLAGGGMPERWINHAQGKKGKGTQGTYTRPPLDKLLKEFKKAYHALAMNTPSSEQLQKNIIDLQDQLDQLQNGIDKGGLLDMYEWLKSNEENVTLKQALDEYLLEKERDELLKQMRREDEAKKK